MKKMMISVIGIIIVAIGALVFLNNNQQATKMDTEDIKQLVQDYTDRKYSNHSASITSHQLIVNTDQEQLVYDLPKDEFFVSIAPFVNQTHPCAIHSLTGCQGEMVNEEFDVYIEDKDGKVVVDQKMETLANGFIDLWLPRDKQYTIKITQDGKTAKSTISTFENDNTCITTIQLKENNV